MPLCLSHNNNKERDTAQIFYQSRCLYRRTSTKWAAKGGSQPNTQLNPNQTPAKAKHRDRDDKGVMP